VAGRGLGALFHAKGPFTYAQKTWYCTAAKYPLWRTRYQTESEAKSLIFNDMTTLLL
jgi:hypothetical protein